jgi:ADP-ribose pyrophosphatase
MPLKKWKKISEAILFKNPWWVYKKDETLLPHGKKGEYHYVYTNGASMVVPVMADGRIVLVNQYRYLNDRESWEFPCGGVKDGHSYEQTAIQELEEEAGFKAHDWKMIGEFNPYNGVTNEICRVFLVRTLIEVPAQPDETEEFERNSYLPCEIDDMIKSGLIWDGMTIAGWMYVKSAL